MEVDRFDDWYNTSTYPPYYFGKTCVIMPCRNRNEFLTHSIPAWLSQSYQRFELVLIDYNSRRSVYADAKPIADKFGVEIELNPDTSRDRYVDYSKITVFTVAEVKQWNMAHALNFGIKRTTSDVISIAGCDTVPDPRYLELALHMTSERQLASVWCGRVTFPRKVWAELNGYQEMCTGWGYEDNDWRFRVTRSGYQIQEMNVMMCPSVAHVSLRGRNARESSAKNKVKCRRYVNRHGLIGNYSLETGGDWPITERNIECHVVEIAKLTDPVSDGELITKVSTYAGKIDDRTVFYIIPETSRDSAFSDSIEQKVDSVQTMRCKESVWEILENIHKPEWRDQHTDVEWRDGAYT